MKEWPVYVTTGNESSKISHMASVHTVVMVTLLPILINNRNIAQKGLDVRGQSKREVLKEVLRWVLQRLTCKPNPKAESGYYNILCVDDNFRCCKQVLAAWRADCHKYTNLHHLERHVWFWCDCPKNALGDYVPSDTQHPGQDNNLYRMLSNTNTKAAEAKLSSPQVNR
jgi:hypothetical protein